MFLVRYLLSSERTKIALLCVSRVSPLRLNNRAKIFLEMTAAEEGHFIKPAAAGEGFSRFINMNENTCRSDI